MLHVRLAGQLPNDGLSFFLAAYVALAGVQLGVMLRITNVGLQHMPDTSTDSGAHW